MLKLSIIIVNWNGLGAIEDCLNSIYKSVTISFEVIVIDNNSSDESVGVIREKYPQVILLQETSNLGFSRANNEGFLKATGEYILILNPDTVVLNNAIGKMINFLNDHEEIGILGPKIFDKNGRVSFLAKKKLPNIKDDLKFLFLIDRIKGRMPDIMRKVIIRDYYEESGECECLSGTCMLFRRNIFEMLGGFDESAPMYLDDNDICYRSRSNGLKNYYLAEAAILHLHQYSTKKAKNYKLFDVLGLQAHLLYYRKHFGPKKVLLLKIFILLSIPYLFGIDFITAPVFLCLKKKGELGWIIKKHLKYCEIVFSNKIQFNILK